MIAFDLEATVGIVLDELKKRNIKLPAGTQPTIGTVPCLVKLAGCRIDVDEFREKVANHTFSARPDWKDIACFMGGAIPECLADEAERAKARDGKLHGSGPCPYMPSDID